MKRIGWKVLSGHTTLFCPSDQRHAALDVRISALMKEGWVPKGAMTRAHPSSTIWCQIMVKYAPA